MDYANIHGAKIIVAEDTKFSREIIRAILRKDGFTNVIFSVDGPDTIELIKNEKPDLLILDLNMPRLSGLDVCKWVRKNEDFCHLPILVQSILETPKDRNIAFKVGATDYVTKPINAPELLARVYIHLENKLLIGELSNFNSRVIKELALARQMQRSIMPDDELIYKMNKQYKLNIQAYSKASSELGGDIWGLISLGDHQLGFYILDVSGHGVGAALNTFRLNQILDQNWSPGIEPGAVIKRVNNLISPKMETGQFTTMLCGIVDVEKKTLSYGSAAQPSPLLVNDDVMLCQSEGHLVGIMKDMDYDSHTVDFKEGSSFLTYSDALIETKNHDGIIMGEDGILEYISHYIKGRETNDYFNPLIQHFNKYYKANLNDDLTILNITNIGGE